MKVVIIANGDPPNAEDVARWVGSEDMLICADGGARVALRLGLWPRHVIGDFDSLDTADLRALQAHGVQLHRYPSHKDETDLELALRFAARQLAPPADEIVVLGAFGGRRDHEMGNILLLAMPDLRGRTVTFAHGDTRLFLIDARHAPAQRAWEGAPGDVVSLIPIGGDAHGVRTEGLEYALRGESLAFGPARGVSNVMTAPRAQVSVQQGALLCFVIRQH